MSLLDKLLPRGIKNKKEVAQNENLIKLHELYDALSDLLECNRYISKREYVPLINNYVNTIHFFDAIKSGNMVEQFCVKNAEDSIYVNKAIHTYSEIDKLIDEHNEEFIVNSLDSEKQYLDNVLKPIDEAIILDDDQRRVVLSDEDYTLVIAGAGAGKTTTVAAKVKYLVDKQGVNPSQILVVSFTNKAVNELKEKIQGQLGIQCPIATFHSTGNAIIHKNSPDEKLNIVDNTKLYFVIRDYFRNSIMRNESVVNNLIMFFASYFDAPYVGEDFNGFFNNIAKANYSTMRSDLEEFKRNVIDARTKNQSLFKMNFYALIKKWKSLTFFI